MNSENQFKKNVTGDQNGPIYPLLKSNDWADQMLDSGEIMSSSFYSGTIENQRNPVVAYCYDMGENVTFLRSNDLGLSINPEVLHDQSLKNLSLALADATGWQYIDFGDGLKEMEVIVFSGNYYCAEGVLLADVMKRAHKKLDAKILAVSIPARGKMFAINAHAVDDHLQRFIMASIRQYYNAESTPISPVIWHVIEGNVVGYIEGTDELEEIIESELLQEDLDRIEEQDNVSQTVHVEGIAINDEDGETLHLTFTTEDWRILINTIESVAQSIADKYSGSKDLSGRINIIVTTTETVRKNQDQLEDNLVKLISFLNNQMQSIGQGPDFNRPFIFQYEMIEKN